MNHFTCTKKCKAPAFQKSSVGRLFPNDFQNWFCFELLKMEQLIAYGHLKIDYIP